jgi:hypothetical protein
MKTRCTNPNAPVFQNYGARGITVCDEWFNNYEAFRDWAMANGYADDLEIDRRENDGNYEPGNCRWVTRIVQQRNSRNNHLVTIDGVTRCVIEWSEVNGISMDTIDSRRHRGWTIERAVSQPVRGAK